MKCVHGVRIDKPCPDCEYENRWRKTTPSPYELTEKDGWPALDADIRAADRTPPGGR